VNRPHVERGKERRNDKRASERVEETCAWEAELGNPGRRGPDRRQPAEGVTSRALIESLCESAIGLNQGWSRTNAEWLRDLALRGLQGPSAEEVELARDQVDDPDSPVSELLARAILWWEGKS
jgi:hypothetical protein